ncbi:MAG UNVERIFIED_CONTAM: hypothetical protein LVR29_33250 [Microcystis novacekii LVE1205-3]
MILDIGSLVLVRYPDYVREDWDMWKRGKLGKMVNSLRPFRQGKTNPIAFPRGNRF